MHNLKFTVEFDESWTARMDPMISSRIESMKRNTIVLDKLIELGLESVDELNNRQKGLLWAYITLMRELIKFEGQQAREVALREKVEEIKTGFPIVVEPD
jgi:archaellum component FlaC